MRAWRSYLIIYDVEDNKVRRKVVKELESYGIRVQKSAFECYVDEQRLSRMTAKLNKLIGEEDSIRIYTPAGKVFDVGDRSEIDLYSQSVFIV